MSGNRHSIGDFAERMASLAEAHKEDIAAIVVEVKAAEHDPGAVKRLASWKRKDPTKRADAEALDHQYRFLAGEVPDAAELPTGGELATAVRLYREGMTVSQVETEMGVSRGKAHKLKTQAAAFSGVHVHLNVNAAPETGELPRGMVAGDLGDWTPEEINLPPKPVSILPAFGVWQQITAPVLEQVAAAEADRAAKEAERARIRAEKAELAERNRRIDADKLEFPPHLKRERAAA